MSWNHFTSRANIPWSLQIHHLSGTTTTCENGCMPVLCLWKHTPWLQVANLSETANESRMLTYFFKFFDSSTSSFPGRGSQWSQGCHWPRQGGNAMRCHEMLCRLAFFHSAVLGFVAGTWRDVSGGPGCHEVRLLSFCPNNLGFKRTQQACKHHPND